MRDDENELLRQLAGVRPRGPGRPYPEELRRAVVTWTNRRVAEGGSVHASAAALGLRQQTLSRWIASESPFRSVAVTGEMGQVAIPLRAESLVVHGPRGLRLEGLDLDGVVELWRRLS